jgi:hypothetical protein
MTRAGFPRCSFGLADFNLRLSANGFNSSRFLCAHFFEIDAKLIFDSINF